jgi:hypothetical protein
MRAMEPTHLESTIMEFLLRGEHPVLAALRRQWTCAKLTDREMTGVGCFVTIEVPHPAPSLTTKDRIALADVAVDLPGREAALGAVVFIENGVLAMLELFTFDGPWPDDTSGFEVKYIQEPRVLSKLDGASAS